MTHISFLINSLSLSNIFYYHNLVVTVPQGVLYIVSEFLEKELEILFIAKGMQQWKEKEKKSITGGNT